MKFFRNITKQAFILIISEVLFVGLLSFGINQYVFSFMENWTWWQYSLFVLGVIAIIAITIIVLEPITKKIKERKSTNMIQSNRDKIQELQTELLQDFFSKRVKSLLCYKKFLVQNNLLSLPAPPIKRFKKNLCPAERRNGDYLCR